MKKVFSRFSSKTYLIAFFCIVFLATIATSILKIMTPKTQTEIVDTPKEFMTNYDGSISTFSGIEYFGPDTYQNQVGQPFGVFSDYQSDSKLQFQEFITNLINKFNFSLAETALGIEYYRSSNMEMVVNNAINKVTITDSSIQTNSLFSIDTNTTPEVVLDSDISPTSSQFVPLSLEDAVAVSTTYLNDIMPASGFEPIPNSAIYYAGQLHLENVKPELAEYIEVPFAQIINQTPVFIDHSVTEPIRIMVSIEKKVQKATFYPFSLAPEPISTLPLLSVEDVIQAINESQLAAIVYAQQDGISPYSTSNIVSGRMSSVRLEYRLDKRTRLLLPHYRFSGSITNQNNENLNVEIVAPALRIELVRQNGQ